MGLTDRIMGACLTFDNIIRVRRIRLPCAHMKRGNDPERYV